MTVPPRTEPMPAAVQDALARKIRLPDDVVQALPEPHRRVVQSYMRLMTPPSPAAPADSVMPKARKVYRP